MASVEQFSDDVEQVRNEVIQPTWESDCKTVKLWLGECLETMRSWKNDAVEAIVADPPYGCGKADWDQCFPSKWFFEACRVSQSTATITGSAGLVDVMNMVQDKYVDTIAARNLNGMTKGPIGYGNWISCVLTGRKPSRGVNAFDFCVRGKKPKHPSPKPIEYMQKLLKRLAFETIADPFMGSGTTGVAAVRLGSSFWGVELNQDYFDIAKKRIVDELQKVKFLEPERSKNLQPSLFSDQMSAVRT